jgi:hypothetical protein
VPVRRIGTTEEYGAKMLPLDLGRKRMTGAEKRAATARLAPEKETTRGTVE